jgi:dUTP pyrophosphatase
MATTQMFIALIHPNAQIPVRATEGSAGYDLYSVEDVTIQPGERCLVSTGIRITVPRGTYGRIAPRSGLAVRNGIDIGAGVIDSDYQGEVKVLMMNLDTTVAAHFPEGTRVAQLIVEKCEHPLIVAVDENYYNTVSTERGNGGFGSTGTA